MQWELIVVLIIVAIQIILFPAAYVWYLNFGGIYAAIKEARAKWAAQRASEKSKSNSQVANLPVGLKK